MRRARCNEIWPASIYMFNSLKLLYPPQPCKSVCSPVQCTAPMERMASWSAMFIYCFVVRSFCTSFAVPPSPPFIGTETCVSAQESIAEHEEVDFRCVSICQHDTKNHHCNTFAKPSQHPEREVFDLRFPVCGQRVKPCSHTVLHTLAPRTSNTKRTKERKENETKREKMS